MALVLKRIFQGYFHIFNELVDPRTEDMFLMSSPIPIIVIVTLWFFFICKWGPQLMKNREPFNIKKIMIVYNIVQVLCNMYILRYVYLARNIISWRCTEIDYSNSYWGLLFLKVTHLYFLLKVLDLMDTVFFILRKKSNHISFLHVYHHFGMVMATWVGTKFVGGGHAYFFGLANCSVHTMLYSYYLLTAYDSKYSKLLWLKKFITQVQLFQFIFLLLCFIQPLVTSDCKFPPLVSFFLIPQNVFMIVLFSDFYVRTYYLEPRRKQREVSKKKLEMVMK